MCTYNMHAYHNIVKHPCLENGVERVRHARMREIRIVCEAISADFTQHVSIKAFYLIQPVASAAASSTWPFCRASAAIAS
jgi:hypothetical protein